MRYVAVNKETGEYVIKAKVIEITTRISGKNTKTDSVKIIEETLDKMKAKVFFNISDLRDHCGRQWKENFIAEPYYLLCKNCKKAVKHSVAGKEFYGCTNQVGVFPVSSGFVVCKSHDPIKKYDKKKKVQNEDQ